MITMRRLRRLTSVVLCTGMLVAFAIPVDAAGNPPPATAKVKATVTVSGVISGLTISVGGSTSGSTGSITDSYPSQSNMGGTVSVNCTQNVSGATPTSDNASLTANYTSVSTTKQVIYMYCLDRYSVKDFRGTGGGYRVTMQATTWKCTTPAAKNGCTAGTAISTTSAFYMDVPQVACNVPEPCTGHGAPPAIKMTGSLPIDTTSGVVVASAAANTGMGTYQFTPRTDVCGPNQQCYNSSGVLLTGSSAAGQLGLYPSTTAKNGTYSSTLTESVIAGP